jgi:beta-lactamase class D
MRRALIPFTVAAACSSSSSPTPSPPPPTPAIADAAPAIDAPDPLAVIQAAWPDGCFTARSGGRTLTSDATRCGLARRPYSTFKIPNALIALDVGVLSGADAAMTWDRKAVPDEPRYFDVWRKPHTLRSGLAVSAVPYFRTLARQIGAERMRDGLARLGYGNQDISGGLDQFWLRGGIRISADQQVAFMDQLARGEVASFAAAAQMTVRDIMKLDDRGGAILRGKTGSGPIEDGKGGWLVWLVGWVERDSTTIPFAAWMEVPSGEMDAARAARDARVRSTLAALGWIDQPRP